MYPQRQRGSTLIAPIGGLVSSYVKFSFIKNSLAGSDISVEFLTMLIGLCEDERLAKICIQLDLQGQRTFMLILLATLVDKKELCIYLAFLLVICPLIRPCKELIY